MLHRYISQFLEYCQLADLSVRSISHFRFLLSTYFLASVPSFIDASIVFQVFLDFCIKSIVKGPIS
jgi:hypothetical protein